MSIIIGYIVLLLVQYFAIQALPITIISSIFSRLTNNLYLGIIIGGICTWLLINFLWIKTFEEPLPLLAFILSLGLQLLHGNLSNSELTDTSKKMVVGEMWAIILVALYVLVVVDFNWY